MKKILSLIIASAMTAALCCQASAAWTKGDFSEGLLSGVILADDGVIATDIYNKVVWKAAFDGMPEIVFGNVAPKGLAGEPTALDIDGKKEEAYFMFPWGIAKYGDGYALTDSDADAVKYITDDGVKKLTLSEKIKNPTGICADGIRKLCADRQHFT